MYFLSAAELSHSVQALVPEFSPAKFLVCLSPGDGCGGVGGVGGWALVSLMIDASIVYCDAM